MLRSAWCVLTLSVCAVSAQSDPLVRDERKQHLPDLVWTQVPHLLDADGDGDLDAVVSAGDDRQLRLLLNLGRFRFADVSTSSMPPLPGFVLASADVDGDGDLDLFCDGPRLLLNDGAGGYGNATVGRLPPLPNATFGFAVGDVDGDGDVDAFASTTSAAWLLRNDGAGVFQASVAAPEAIAAIHARLADLDGDGDLDLVVVTATGAAILRNDGRGQFTPLVGALTLLSFVEDLALADVDRDGDLDLMVGHLVLPGASRQLYLNDGQGRFTNVTASRLPATSATTTSTIAARDVDADGDLDLLLAQDSFLSELLLNDGRGHFLVGDAGDLRTLLLLRPAVGDLDGDGFADVLTAPNHILAGRAGGAFALLDPAAIEADAEAVVAVLDFTGDGDADLLQGIGQPSGAGGGFVVKRNDGTGSFRPVHYSVALPHGTSATAVGDVDGDGDPDVLRSVRLGAATAELHLLRNRGDGSFAQPNTITLPVGAPFALYLDDVDGDGDLDAIDVSLSAVNVLHNDGLGNFTLGARVSSTAVYGADLFDYDGDGDGDLFVTTVGTRLLENQAGLFVDVTSQRFPAPPPFGLPRLMRIANVTWLLVVSRDIHVFQAQGAGFAPYPQLDYFLGEVPLGARVVPTSWNGAIASHLAVQTGTAASPRVRLLSFDGYDRPRDVTREVLGDAPYTDVRFAGDVDADGDVDLIADRAGRDRRLLRGTLRSFTAPYAALLGRTFEYRLRDATVTTSNPALVSLVFGPGLVRLPLAGLGILRLDPAAAVVLPPAVVPVQGTLSMTFAIPADLALRDASVVAQPFTVYVFGGTGTLGAALHEVIR